MKIRFKNLSKPFVVEFAGPPKSGKTTIIDRIKYELPYTFSILKEVSLDSPVPKKQVLKYMEWSANELINKLLFSEEMIGKQILLVDCGIISQLALLKAFKKSGRIRHKELEYYNLIRTHLLMNLKREDVVFYIHMDINTEIKRVKNYKFPKGFIINEKFLKVLNESYKETINDVKAIRRLIKINVFEIEGGLSPEFNSNKVKKLILKEYKLASQRKK